MKKSEIKKASNAELVFDYITSFSRAVLAENFSDIPKTRLNKHLNDLAAEMLNRELLTQDHIKKLNM